ncbi:sugar phosphate isomerase/epimerase family protein [Oceanobacillus sp. CF4.6]|uniref:sugar phosphate isomerase/epimerase family protein n=1 Tax=Oceanobacillus sp. CF4.6 TaxID=3373080 RepID=UPI003EE70578
MKLFFASSLCWDYPPIGVIAIAKENKVQGLELWAEHIYHHQSDPYEIRSAADKEGITLSLHASSWDLNICSINKGIQEQSVRELKKSIDLAEALQVVHMTFHPGRFTVKNYLANEHMQAMVKNTRMLVEYAAAKGVILSQELMEPIPKEIITNPRVMNTFLEQVGQGLHVTLDIAHTPLEENSINYLDKLERVNSIHLSDSSKKQYHLPLGEGEIDLDSVLTSLSNTDFPVVLEGMDTSRELTFLKKHLAFLQNAGWIERKTNV